jgi:quinol monooxygenase YgiN
MAMTCNRRELALIGAAAAAGVASAPAEAWPGSGSGGGGGGSGPYGVVSQILAASGRRNELVAVLLEGARNMPGCRAYLVAGDVAHEEAIWVTEVWDSREAHARAVASPAVQAANAKAGPLIAGFASHAETTPLGSVGLAQR